MTSLKAKQIVFSMGALVFTLAVVAGYTGAFFSDTETVKGNTFQAGTFNLTATSSHAFASASWTNGFTINGMLPGHMERVAPKLKTTSDAWLRASINISADEDGTEAEANTSLRAAMNVMVYEATTTPALGTSTGAIAIHPLEKHTDGKYYPASPLRSSHHEDYYLGFLVCFGDIQNTDPKNLLAYSCDGKKVDNDAQGGTAMVDLEIYAEQFTNNENATQTTVTTKDADGKDITLPKVIFTNPLKPTTAAPVIGAR